MFGPETAHSPNAEDMNTLYWVALAVVAVLGLAINGALIAAIARGRGSEEPRRLRSTRRPQVLAATGLGTLATALFVAGVIFTESSADVEASGPGGLGASSQLLAQSNLSLPPGDEEVLQVTASGQQWLWRYEYPAGGAPEDEASFADTFTYHELVVPVDTTVVVTVESTDVFHEWWVPGLTAKVEVGPASPGQTWFKADEEGTYEGASYEFSGAAFASMATTVRVVSPTEYEAFIAERAEQINEAQGAVQDGPPGGGGGE